MVRQHHRFNGHEFEQTPGDSEDGHLACFCPQGHKGSNVMSQAEQQLKRAIPESEACTFCRGRGFCSVVSHTGKQEAWVGPDIPAW